MLLRTILSLFLLLISASPYSHAWGRKKQHPADLNHDGHITHREILQYKNFRKEHNKIENKWVTKRREWRDYKYMVTNHAEEQYDSDGDGWLMPAETKKLLYNKYKEIRRSGSAPAITQFEQMYDINHDGRLDEDEAVAIRQDL